MVCGGAWTPGWLVSVRVSGRLSLVSNFTCP